ncbi:hypothetical protein pb186bvf_006461 [Paramecium bursaria]
MSNLIFLSFRGQIFQFNQTFQFKISQGFFEKDQRIIQFGQIKKLKNYKGIFNCIIYQLSQKKWRMNERQFRLQNKFQRTKYSKILDLQFRYPIN